jgi:hypothetical protein
MDHENDEDLDRVDSVETRHGFLRGKPWSAPRWTVVGLHEPGRYRNDTFVCYVAADTATEAAEWAVQVNAERGDKISVIACVSGGGVAHRIRPDNDIPNLPFTPDYAAFGETVGKL